MADRSPEIDDLSNWSHEDLIAEATQWADQYEEGEDGYCAPEQAAWRVENAYPLAQVCPTEEERQVWIDWINAEIKMWAEEGQPDRFNDMADGKIVEHAVILVRDSQHYIWDGNHRVASAIKAGALTIPAIIGTPIPELEMQPKLGENPAGKVSSALGL